MNPKNSKFISTQYETIYKELDLYRTKTFNYKRALKSLLDSKKLTLANSFAELKEKNIILQEEKNRLNSEINEIKLKFENEKKVIQNIKQTQQSKIEVLITELHFEEAAAALEVDNAESNLKKQLNALNDKVRLTLNSIQTLRNEIRLTTEEHALYKNQTEKKIQSLKQNCESVKEQIIQAEIKITANTHIIDDYFEFQDTSNFNNLELTTSQELEEAIQDTSIFLEKTSNKNIYNKKNETIQPNEGIENTLQNLGDFILVEKLFSNDEEKNENTDTEHYSGYNRSAENARCISTDTFEKNLLINELGMSKQSENATLLLEDNINEIRNLKKSKYCICDDEDEEQVVQRHNSDSVQNNLDKKKNVPKPFLNEKLERNTEKHKTHALDYYLDSEEMFENNSKEKKCKETSTNLPSIGIVPSSPTYCTRRTPRYYKGSGRPFKKIPTNFVSPFISRRNIDVEENRKKVEVGICKTTVETIEIEPRKTIKKRRLYNPDDLSYLLELDKISK